MIRGELGERGPLGRTMGAFGKVGHCRPGRRQPEFHIVRQQLPRRDRMLTRQAGARPGSDDQLVTSCQAEAAERARDRLGRIGGQHG